MCEPPGRWPVRERVWEGGRGAGAGGGGWPDTVWGPLRPTGRGLGRWFRGRVWGWAVAVGILGVGFPVSGSGSLGRLTMRSSACGLSLCLVVWSGVPGCWPGPGPPADGPGRLGFRSVVVLVLGFPGLCFEGGRAGGGPAGGGF